MHFSAATASNIRSSAAPPQEDHSNVPSREQAPAKLRSPTTAAQEDDSVLPYGKQAAGKLCPSKGIIRASTSQGEHDDPMSKLNSIRSATAA